MTQSERNEWLLKNMDIITSTIHRKCEREPELDYDELYSDMMEYLIGRCDNKNYGDEMLSYDRSRITQLVGNRMNAVKKHVKPQEELYDPSHLELIYIPDFESGISKWEYEEVAMTDRERDIFDRYVTGDYTLEELAREYDLTTERIRQIWLKACRKVFWQKYLAKGKIHLYFRIKSDGVLRHGDHDIKPVKFTVNAIVKGRDEKRIMNRLKSLIAKEIDGYVSYNTEVIFYRYYEGFKIVPFLSKDDNLETLYLDFDRKMFSKVEPEPEPKKEPKYICEDGYILNYSLGYQYTKVHADGSFERVIQCRPVEHKIIASNESAARMHYLCHIEEEIEALLPEGANLYSIDSPRSPEEIKTRKVIFKRKAI